MSRGGGLRAIEDVRIALSISSTVLRSHWNQPCPFVTSKYLLHVLLERSKIEGILTSKNQPTWLKPISSVEEFLPIR